MCTDAYIYSQGEREKEQIFWVGGICQSNARLIFLFIYLVDCLQFFAYLPGENKKKEDMKFCFFSFKHYYNIILSYDNKKTKLSKHHSNFKKKNNIKLWDKEYWDWIYYESMKKSLRSSAVSTIVDNDSE